MFAAVRLRSWYKPHDTGAYSQQTGVSVDHLHERANPQSRMVSAGGCLRIADMVEKTSFQL